MAIIDFTNFERQGKTEDDIRLESANEITQAVLQQTASTLQTVKIFSHDLEKDIYNNDAFRAALLKLARATDTQQYRYWSTTSAPPCTKAIN